MGVSRVGTDSEVHPVSVCGGSARSGTGIASVHLNSLSGFRLRVVCVPDVADFLLELSFKSDGFRRGKFFLRVPIDEFEEVDSILE